MATSFFVLLFFFLRFQEAMIQSELTVVLRRYGSDRYSYGAARLFTHNNHKIALNQCPTYYKYD